MSNTSVRYTATAGQTEFDLTFPYLRKEHIVVRVNSVNAAFTWVSSTRIALNTAAAEGDIVEVRRETDLTAPLVTFTNSSILTSEDLNLIQTQLRYATQELEERAIAAEQFAAAMDEVEALEDTILNTQAVFIPSTQSNVSGNQYTLTHGRELPNNTGDGVYFIVQVTTEHVEGGLSASVEGINPNDPLQILTPAGDQVPPGTLSAPGFMMITRPGGVGHYKLVYPEATSDPTPAPTVYLPDAGSTGTALTITVDPASLPADPSEALFPVILAADKGEGGFTFNVVGLTNELRQVLLPDGNQVPSGLLKGGGYALIRYNGNTGVFTLLYPADSSASPSLLQRVTQPTPATNAWVLTPTGTLVDNEGYTTVFRYRVDLDQAEGGVTVVVTGINDADPLPLVDRDGGEIVPGTFAAGDEIEFIRSNTPGATQYKYVLTSVSGSSLGDGGGGGASLSDYEKIAARFAAINAAEARQMAAEALDEVAVARTEAAAAQADADTANTELASKQPLNSILTSFGGLTGVADRLPYFTGADTFALATFTAFGRSLVDDADASAARTTLGIGTIATQDASNVAVTGGAVRGLTGLQIAGNTGLPPSGSGVEIYGGSVGVFQAYNRTGGAYIGFNIDASTISFRPNGSLRALVDGNGISITGSVKPSSYTVATLPSAGSHGAGAVVYCSNESGGAAPVFSDGSNWRRFSDRAIAS